MIAVTLTDFSAPQLGMDRAFTATELAYAIDGQLPPLDARAEGERFVALAIGQLGTSVRPRLVIEVRPVSVPGRLFAVRTVPESDPRWDMDIPITRARVTYLAAPEEPRFHGATGWQAWVPEIDDLEWYADTPAVYAGPEAASGTDRPEDQLEAARRFIKGWLNGNAHGFVIPGGEWGRSLKHWLETLLSHTSPLSERIAAGGDSIVRYAEMTPEQRSAYADKMRAAAETAGSAEDAQWFLERARRFDPEETPTPDDDRVVLTPEQRAWHARMLRQAARTASEPTSSWLVRRAEWFENPPLSGIAVGDEPEPTT